MSDNASNCPDLALPKPEPRKRVKARLRRKETAVKQDVRPQCVIRDGYCRLNVVSDADVHEAIIQLFGECRGYSQWAHLGEKRRSKTVGMPPEERHTVEDSLMLCDGHHDRYDAHEFDIEKLSLEGAEGLLRFVTPDGESYTEAE
jgi:hypothetical protein